MASATYTIPRGCSIRSVQKPIQFFGLFLPDKGERGGFPVEVYRHHTLDVIAPDGEVVHELIGEITLPLN